MNSRALRSVCSIVALGLVALSFSACAAEKTEAAQTTPQSETTALPVVGPAPDWKLTTLDGRELGREQLKGKVVVVDFWATWCPPCVYEIPGYVKMQERLRDRGLVIVGLSSDRGPEVVRTFAEKRQVNYPLAMAGTETADLFGGVEAIPTTFLIDREGNIRHKKVGAMEAEEYQKLVESLL